MIVNVIELKLNSNDTLIQQYTDVCLKIFNYIKNIILDNVNSTLIQLILVDYHAQLCFPG
ncbi:hypothetical protein AB8Q19_00075 [Candidatus Profftella armatura]